MFHEICSLGLLPFCETVSWVWERSKGGVWGKGSQCWDTCSFCYLIVTSSAVLHKGGHFSYLLIYISVWGLSFWQMTTPLKDGWSWRFRVFSMTPKQNNSWPNHLLIHIMKQLSLWDSTSYSRMLLKELYSDQARYSLRLEGGLQVVFDICNYNTTPLVS